MWDGSFLNLLCGKKRKEKHNGTFHVPWKSELVAWKNVTPELTTYQYNKLENNQQYAGYMRIQTL